jgi:SSS family solute:Na+ symporter
VFTWLQLPLGALQATLHLNAVAVFFSAVFGFDLSLTIIVLGLIVLTVALFGGSWAVIAGDFIQMLILMPVCLTVTVLAVVHLGGFGGFLEKIPAGHLDFHAVLNRDFLGLWCIAMLLKQTISTNNLIDANRYLSVKDSRHARWAGFLGAGLYLVGIVVWFIPPMAARALFPDLHGQFPNLPHPEEASFIAITRAVAPVG